MRIHWRSEAEGRREDYNASTTYIDWEKTESARKGIGLLVSTDSGQMRDYNTRTTPLMGESVREGTDPLVSRGSGQMRPQGDYNATITSIDGEIAESVRIIGEQRLRADRGREDYNATITSIDGEIAEWVRIHWQAEAQGR